MNKGSDLESRLNLTIIFVSDKNKFLQIPDLTSLARFLFQFYYKHDMQQESHRSVFHFHVYVIVACHEYRLQWFCLCK